MIVNTIDGHGNKCLLSGAAGAGLAAGGADGVAVAQRGELALFPVERMVGRLLGRHATSRASTCRRTGRSWSGSASGSPAERVNDAMQTAYSGVYLWKKAVEKAGTTEHGGGAAGAARA